MWCVPRPKRPSVRTGVAITYQVSALVLLFIDKECANYKTFFLWPGDKRRVVLAGEEPGYIHASYVTVICSEICS